MKIMKLNIFYRLIGIVFFPIHFPTFLVFCIINKETRFIGLNNLVRCWVALAIRGYLREIDLNMEELK